MTDVYEHWERPIVKAAAAIHARLHQTGREPRRFDQLDADTRDDLCIQAEAAIRAYAEASTSPQPSQWFKPNR